MELHGVLTIIVFKALFFSLIHSLIIALITIECQILNMGVLTIMITLWMDETMTNCFTHLPSY